VRLLDSAESEPVNLGNPREMTILEFARTRAEADRDGVEDRVPRPEDERTQDDPQTASPTSPAPARSSAGSRGVPGRGLGKTIEYFRRLF
jgi:dTDP-glucose 4,6-dehydratase